MSGLKDKQSLADQVLMRIEALDKGDQMRSRGRSSSRIVAMKLSLALITYPLAASAYGSYLRKYTHPAPYKQNDTGSVYKTDLFEGTHIQEEISDLNASDLTYTLKNGAKYFQPQGAQRAGEKGPLLLQDVNLIDSLATFVRERIPERVVHARGAGAHGFFEATTDFAANLSAAEFFKKGTKTSVTMRFSTVGGSRGSADEARDPRGVSIKFRTKQGILDWVFNNTPVFFIRDPAKFPRFIHTQKTDPATNARDWNTFWSWPAQFPEALLQFLRLLSDLGTPYGFRHMDAWSGHTYKLVKDDGSWVYARVYLQTDQGVKNFTDAEAKKIASQNDAWATADLFDSIKEGNYPSWTVGIATKTVEEAEAYRYDILDLTKDWPDAVYNEVGRITLTQNPENYFAEIEQAHFSPGELIPGWEPSNDPVLQSRLFSYNDAGRYRLGVNYQNIPVNCPFAPVANWDRDGHLNTLGNQGSRPNFPAEFIDPLNIIERPATVIEQPLNGSTVHWESEIDESIDYEQPRIFYEQQIAQHDRDNLHSNIAGTFLMVDNEAVRNTLYKEFGKISSDLEAGVRAAYKEALAAQS
ncbi:catalase-like protein [Polychaeton citri CBS 116435]|uniref:Catalase-like protein n=1 Tax=Polychaeton citri CBS 116435 TaxID=1314669 RepID=A0A9P4UTM9_9PEZI|nr:catalase-like protein [Polychaeton citri CBS 116435]